MALFTGINLFVTWRFDASVEKQGAAYATGVLVLMFGLTAWLIEPDTAEGDH